LRQRECGRTSNADAGTWLPVMARAYDDDAPANVGGRKPSASADRVSPTSNEPSRCPRR
jgi:hypothetical protein